MSQVSLSQQLKEGNLFAEQCPSREVLKHVTSRWGVLILVAQNRRGERKDACAVVTGVRTGWFS